MISPFAASRGRGFTLIEILTVVVILGIASAIIVPQIGSRDDLVASAAVRLVMGDLIYAQNRAIATQKKHFVQFTGQQYTLMARDSDAGALYTISNPVTKNNYTTAFGVKGSGLDRATLVSASPTYLAFDELGEPQSYNAGTNALTPLINNGTVTINVGNATLTISIEPYTGETSCQ